MKTTSASHSDLSHICEFGFEWDITLRGHSMEPAITAGSRLHLRRLEATPRVGDVVAFWDSPGRMIVHRVIAVRHHLGHTQCQTKGDANASDDGWISAGRIFGRVTAAKPPSLGTRLTLFGSRLKTALRARFEKGAKAAFSGAPRLEAIAAAPAPERPALLPSMVLRPASQILVHDLQDELLLSLQGVDEIQVLNRSARAIYDLMDGQRSLQLITTELATRYAKPVAELERDVFSTADLLYGYGLLVVSGAAPVSERPQSTK